MEGLRHKWMAPFSEHFRYKWHPGMIAWAAHRITGLGIVLFLVVHIWSISHLGAGPESFDSTMALYSTPLFKLGELGLMAALIFHGLNGLRIVWVDFLGGAKYHKKLLYAVAVGTIVLFIAGFMAMPIK